MNQKLLGLTLIAGVPLVAMSAQAANITGAGTVNITGDVVVRSLPGANGVFDAPLDPANDDEFVFEFSNDGVANEFEIDSTTPPSSGGFAGFVGGTGIINDFTLTSNQLPSNLGPINTNPAGFLLDFDPANAGDEFTNVQFGFASIVPVSSSQTIVFLPVTGTFVSGTGTSFGGTGLFTAQFNSGIGPVLTALRSPNGLNTTYSASLSAVPEPMTMAGTAAALGFGAWLKRRKKAQEA
jgi:hypothetical protein